MFFEVVSKVCISNSNAGTETRYECLEKVNTFCESIKPDNLDPIVIISDLNHRRASFLTQFYISNSYVLLQ